VADAVSVIKEDHQAVAGLFEQFRQAADASEKQRIVQQITEALGQHADMEEQVLYPRMQELLGQEEVGQNYQEHDMMRQSLGEIGSMSADQPGFDEAVEALISKVMDHVRLEEQDELPQLQQQIGQDELDQLGQQMEQFKRGG
jgi:hemerythrin superfamily protein